MEILKIINGKFNYDRKLFQYFYSILKFTVILRNSQMTYSTEFDLYIDTELIEYIFSKKWSLS